MIRCKQIRIRRASDRKIIIGNLSMMLFLFVSGCMLLTSSLTIYGSTISVVSSEQSIGEAATDIDLGDYNSVMAVGEKQLLSITLIPQTVTAQTVTYASDNGSIATINALGRITAVSAGKAKILVSCGSITRTFDLIVKEVESTAEAKIGVTDIEISDYNEKLEVDKTLNLSATVLPSTATDSKLSYTTSNAAIATVNSTGVVKGIAPGNVEITLTAGGYSRNIMLTVKVATTAIKLNNDYLVLRNGESSKIEGKAVPDQTTQELTFKSANEAIATVSCEGKVTAKSIGNTTIIVSNGEMSSAVTVIVNATGEITVINTSADANQEGSVDNSENIDTIFINMLQTEPIANMTSAQYPKVSSTILKALYESKKTLEVSGASYTLTLDGKDIVNYENELVTNVTFDKMESGLEFILNDGENLPGTVRLQIEEASKYKYFYLYNQSKGKYEKLKMDNSTDITIDTPGKYLLTEKKMNGISISLIAVILFVVVVASLSGVYIAVKKKHWFW